MKTKLVERLREKLGTTKREAEALYEVCRETLVEVLMRDGLVRIDGLGTFRVSERVFNVNKVGEKIVKAKRNVVKFKINKSLKEELNS